MLLMFKCPEGVEPKRAWYVPGAVARVGADGLASSWLAYWDEDPPSMRTIREHLRKLQDAGTLVAAPGAWLPVLRHPEHPERRPRYPDTFHILESDSDAEWWAEVGVFQMAEEPSSRFNPDLWARLFSTWRSQSRRRAKAPVSLFPPAQLAAAAAQRGPIEHELDQVVPATEHIIADAETLEAAVVHAKEPIELLEVMGEIGGRIRGGLGFRMVSSGERLRGAVALLAQAMRRGRPIHNRAGWLVGVWRDAKAQELVDAIAVSRSNAIRAELTA